MKWIAIAAGSLAVLLLIVAAVGWMQPVKHRVTREATYRVAQDQLYELITHVDGFPAWRSKVKSVEHVSPTQFREIGDDETILYEMMVRTPGERLVTRIADATLPFGGSWTYELTSAGEGRTRLRITEDGEVYNPVFRFVSRFVMGHTATIDAYLRDVGRHLKEEAVIASRD